MKIVIRAVGKLRDRRLEELVREYLDRARRHVPVDVVEVEDDAGLRAAVAPGTDVVALDARGEGWSTEQLARFIEDKMVHGAKAVVFLIGGAEGLSPATLAFASKKLSLGKMIFPHRLVRLMLSEQIYRAISDIRGEPYHRG